MPPWPFLSRPQPLTPTLFHRSLSLWSSTKEPALESALARNRRWIVNNQIKHLLLRSPSHTLPVRSLQKHFKTLDLQGSALNWLRKYPSVFSTLPNPQDSSDQALFTFSKRMAALVADEQSALSSSEPAMANRLSKLLMLSKDRRLNVVKFNQLKRSFGFPDDYLLRLIPKYPERFRISSNIARRSSMEIELLNWDPTLAISAMESAAISRGTEPKFSCSLPSTWIKSREKFDLFNEGSPYVSPYDKEALDSEKKDVGLVHELLSLTLWKKMSILKLEQFRREFGLPERLNWLLLRYPCIFYVSNRYKIYTVVLREGYRGAELAEKDPVVVVKDRVGELMQEGLHEYNRRRCAANVEKRRRRGEVKVRVNKEDEEEDGSEVSERERVERREERKRFYKVLFDERP